jgi:hypothetical protein
VIRNPAGTDPDRQLTAGLYRFPAGKPQLFLIQQKLGIQALPDGRIRQNSVCFPGRKIRLSAAVGLVTLQDLGYDVLQDIFVLHL